MKTKKEFTVKADDVESKYYVTTPTAANNKDADQYKAKTFTECLLNGIMTKAKLEKIMEDNGVWDDTHKNKEKVIIKEIQDLERKLYLGAGKKKSSLSDGQKIAIKMRQKREELRELLLEKVQLEANTAESLADNARFDFLVSCCTFHENGNSVYNGIEDYNSKSTDEISFSAASILAELMYNYSADSEKSLPENKWLKKFGLVNDNLSLVNKDNELVDTQGRRINEFGYYINDDGQRIDVDGNLLEEDGSYVIQVDYSEKSTRTRKKTTTTADS